MQERNEKNGRDWTGGRRGQRRKEVEYKEEMSQEGNIDSIGILLG